MKGRLPARQRASVTVVALMICIAGSVGLLGMLTIMKARYGQIEAAEEQALRHIRLMNGRQLAKAYVYQGIYPSASGSGGVLATPGPWARINVPAWSESVFDTNTITAAYNHAGPAPDVNPFRVDSAISIFSLLAPDGSWDTASAAETVDFFVLGMNTNLMGYPIEVRRGHNSSVNSAGAGLRTTAGALVWQWPAETNPVAIEAARLNTHNGSLLEADFAPTITSGRADNLPMLGLPAAPYSDGTYIAGNQNVVPNASLSNTYAGQIDALDPPAYAVSGSTASNSNGIVSDGAGQVTIDLSSLSLYTSTIDSASTVIFEGQTDAGEQLAVENLLPTYIYLTSPSTIVLNATNRRPLVILVAGGSSVNFVFGTAGAEYRCFICIQDPASTTFTVNGSATVRGGLSLDYANAVTGGTLTVVPEDINPTAFTGLLRRHVWVESYLRL